MQISNPNVLGRERIILNTDEKGEFNENMMAGENYSIRISNIKDWSQECLSPTSKTFNINEDQRTEIVFNVSSSTNCSGSTKAEIIEGLKNQINDYYSSQEYLMIQVALSSIDVAKKYEILNKLAQKRFWQIATKEKKIQTLNELSTTYPELNALKDVENQNDWYIIPADVPTIDPYNWLNNKGYAENSNESSVFSVEEAKAGVITSTDGKWRKKIKEEMDELDDFIFSRKKTANNKAGYEKYKYAGVAESEFKFDMNEILRKVGNHNDIWGTVTFNYKKCTEITNNYSEKIYNKTLWNKYGKDLFYNIYFPHLRNNYPADKFTKGEKEYVKTMMDLYCNYGLALVENFKAALEWSGGQILFFFGGAFERISARIVTKAGQWGARVSPKTGKVVSGGTRVITGIAAEGGITEWLVSKAFGRLAIASARIAKLKLMMKFKRLFRSKITDSIDDLAHYGLIQSKEKAQDHLDRLSIDAWTPNFATKNLKDPYGFYDTNTDEIVMNIEWFSRQIGYDKDLISIPGTTEEQIIKTIEISDELIYGFEAAVNHEIMHRIISKADHDWLDYFSIKMVQVERGLKEYPWRWKWEPWGITKNIDEKFEVIFQKFLARHNNDANKALQEMIDLFKEGKIDQLK